MLCATLGSSVVLLGVLWYCGGLYGTVGGLCGAVGGCVVLWGGSVVLWGALRGCCGTDGKVLVLWGKGTGASTPQRGPLYPTASTLCRVEQ